MIRGLYSAASGMNILQAKLDVVTNNLANMNTNGYKKDQAVQGSFSDILIIQQGRNKNKSLMPLGISSQGTIFEEIHRDFSQGPIKQTGKYTDLALQGEGFFTVEKDEHTVYTRDGSFTINEEGCLVTAKGDPVLGKNGRIYLGNRDFVVNSDGRIIQNGEMIDYLSIITFDDLKKLQKDGDNYFKESAGTNRRMLDNPQINQGYLEGANILLVDEMVKMLEVSKSYESNQRLIQVQDQLLEKAANEIGSVR